MKQLIKLFKLIPLRLALSLVLSLPICIFVTSNFAIADGAIVDSKSNVGNKENTRAALISSEQPDGTAHPGTENNIDNLHKDNSLENNSPENNSLKIAVVNPQYVLDNSLVLQDIKTKFENLTDKMHDEMIKKEIALKQSEEDLINQRGKISQEDLQKKLTDFHTSVSEAQKYSTKQKIKLEKAHNDAIYSVKKNINDIISSIGEKEKMKIILLSSQLAYFDKDLDITQAVLNELNAKIKSIEINF